MDARRRQMLLGAVAAALVGIALAGCGANEETAGRTTPTMSRGGALTSLNGLSEHVAARYRFIEQHPREAEQIPCYCGCGPTLGHRSLLDCFLAPRGGYESHGAACGVCLGEAQDLEEMLAKGMSLSEARAAIDEAYGTLGAPTVMAH